MKAISSKHVRIAFSLVQNKCKSMETLVFTKKSKNADVRNANLKSLGKSGLNALKQPNCGKNQEKASTMLSVQVKR